MPTPTTTDAELARRIAVDLSVDATNWLTLFGKDDVNPTITPNKQDRSTYENGGWKGYTITQQEASLQVKFYLQSSNAILDATQLMLFDRVGQFGNNARIWVRWYDSQGRDDHAAWYGYAIVEIAKSKTGVPDLDEYTVTFTIDGVLTKMTASQIAGAIAATAPVILSAGPTAVAQGGQVVINGSGFTSTVATTGVKFGATNATSWLVVSDSTIVAVMPAGAAGAANIVVTNSVGASAAFPYTRGA